MMLRLSISTSVGATYAPYLRRHLRQAHRLLDSTLRELSLALVNDRTMSDLHFQFLGISQPTDVLSFALEHDRRRRVITGEVVVCVPEARRNARLHGTEVRNELLLYALHGMLHLSGFEDRTKRGYQRMHRQEDRILSRLGVGPVFKPTGARRIRGCTS